MKVFLLFVFISLAGCSSISSINNPVLDPGQNCWRDRNYHFSGVKTDLEMASTITSIGECGSVFPLKLCFTAIVYSFFDLPFSALADVTFAIPFYASMNSKHEELCKNQELTN